MKVKKKNIINLIKYHMEKDDLQFKFEAAQIARYFDNSGDEQLAEYIMSLISDANVFVPQSTQVESEYMHLIKTVNEPFPLPEAIFEDVKGMINAINHKIGMNKFLFEGAPGTGKTETVKQIARLINRDLLLVETSALIDSKLGQTAKNIVNVFKEINGLRFPTNYIILFDEFDAIAMDRISDNDLREMGRATTSIIKELDRLNDGIVLIATTNLYKRFDKALTRRFDAVVDFNRYSRVDLIEVAVSILNSFLPKFENAKRDIKLFKKIIDMFDEIPYPGDLKNIIKTCLGFSDPQSEFDYLVRLFNLINGDITKYSLEDLSKMNFTLREIESLTGVSRSKASRELRVTNK